MTTPTKQPFPSLKITAQALEPQGAFAEAQAMYLSPDMALVSELDALLHEKNVGIVAHFYMDPELQGVLARCTWPHIHVSDSLLMADSAITMAEAGVTSVIVLGVDFARRTCAPCWTRPGTSRSQSIASRRPPSAARWRSRPRPRPTVRTSARPPSSSARCTSSTSTPAWSPRPRPTLVPTLTCTSSNVVRSVLQAAAQVPDIHIFFGPDTYMGHNLAHLFRSLGEMDAAKVAAVHPAHTPESVRSLSERFHYFEQGTCIVHHMFGAEVVQQVEQSYPDAYVTAHLEVPGEMFALGLERQRRGAGVVGSTSDILTFIEKALRSVIDAGGSEPQTLQFVLGTEAGMITPIVRNVQRVLSAAQQAGGPELAAEIVFPVSSQAIAEVPDSGLTVVPGVAAGEGCSTAGGCATCPYMKMNSLAALFSPHAAPGPRVRRARGLLPAPLQRDHPRAHHRRAGRRAILHARAFQRTGCCPRRWWPIFWGDTPPLDRPPGRLILRAPPCRNAIITKSSGSRRTLTRRR
ncbi:MAG: quinolinate synthase NadA [Sandaracinaceae bacterium]|nr:quinolinate synthase NadA [Sandaracinaceae bacterium]